jgi:nucleotide-binding universal stress UspA family protein
LSSFHRILVGWDGSSDARQALRTASKLAESLAAEVTLLAVLKARSRAEAADEAAEELAERRRQALEEMEAEAHHVAAAPAVRVRCELAEADETSAGFDAYVREHGFDLVVLGRHGRDRALHPRIGTLSEYQVRHGTCPVMVVGSD